MRVILPVTGSYTVKDQAKSDRATKFIGRGSPNSSTNAYAKAWGDRANCGVYIRHDRVFVSVEGARPGRIPLDVDEVAKAIVARATFITDTPFHRNRPYNVGEREIAGMLERNGYTEAQPGVWTPNQ